MFHLCQYYCSKKQKKRKSFLDEKFRGEPWEEGEREEREEEGEREERGKKGERRGKGWKYLVPSLAMQPS